MPPLPLPPSPCSLLRGRVLAIVGGTLIGAYFLSEEYSTDENQFLSLLPALVLALANTFVPPLFQKLGSLERYTSPRTELRMTLARSYILRVAGIYVILVGVFRESADMACWETVYGQEIYRLLIADTLVNIVATPV